MSNAYLDMAETVIRLNRLPMSPQEILDAAYAMDIVPLHLFGKTQLKTMQARLSEDILRLGLQSLFYRTNKARFFLREFINDSVIPEAFKREYIARRRKKSLLDDMMLVFKCNTSSSNEFIWPKSVLVEFLGEQRYFYSTIREIKQLDKEISKNIFPVYAFLIIHDESSVLIHRMGKFIDDQNPVRGKWSIGFGGAVLSVDSDLLYEAYYGIIGRAVNELAYNLGTSRDLIKDIRYNSRITIQCAVGSHIPQSLNAIQVVMNYRLDKNFSVSKNSLTINQLQWVRIADLANLRNLDGTSRFLFDAGIINRIIKDSQ